MIGGAPGVVGRGCRRRCVVALVALVTAAAACGSGSGAGSGDALPELALPDLAGTTTIQLDELEEVSVVNLWATWCAPCRRELPDFEEVHRSMGDEVRFIGVNIGDRADDAARFIDDLGVTFEQYLDLDGQLNEQLGTASLPVTVVTRDDGSISLTHTGPMSAADLIAAITQAQGPTS